MLIMQESTNKNDIANKKKKLSWKKRVCITLCASIIRIKNVVINYYYFD